MTGPFFGRLRRRFGFIAGLSLLLAKRTVLVLLCCVGIMPTTPSGFVGALDGPGHEEAQVPYGSWAPTCAG